MAPPLQGHTLGQRQKYYNELVAIAMEKKPSVIPQINFEEDDVDNMLNIDIACEQRNVEYILDVFKCDDILYVSRAINKSKWLVIASQYAHIVKPAYLDKELFPLMDAKAVTKLMLHIRRYLKDEDRVKDFYEYVNERNQSAVLLWLENSPLEFIESVVANRANDIPLKLLKRLCKKSINILRIFVVHQYTSDACSRVTMVSDITNEMKYFLKNKKTAKTFLDIIEYCENKYSYFAFKLNVKYTHILMKTCPGEIKEKIAVYFKHIDLTTFVKYIKIDEIRSVLTKIDNSWYHWKCFETLTPFLDKLPHNEVLDFLSTLYSVEYSKNNDKSDVQALFNSIEIRRNSSFSNVCRWYRFAPFNIAFHDLKKAILAEFSPYERHKMLITLLTCARYNYVHLKTVLQYYHDKHINEPYMHKKTFIHSLLSQHDAFRFEDDLWNILNNLFHSSEVYIESTNDVQAALISIIVREVLNDRPVHEVVEDKFEIVTLKHIRTKLSFDEQDKVFIYLYTLLVQKINLQSIRSETGMRKATELLQTIWTLIHDWGRVESNNGFIIDKIVELCDVHKTSPWYHEARKLSCRSKKSDQYQKSRQLKQTSPQPFIDMATLYKMVKSYRKHLFETSLVIHSTENVLLNALKHGPGLLSRYKCETDFLRSDDKVSLKRFLTKLRMYWPNSLATEWAETNAVQAGKKLSGHRALVRGILTLLPQNKSLEFIKLHIPDEQKIQWSEINETKLSIQKHVAKNMHISRPQLPAEVVLWYAKGDYLQYAVLSLNTMYYNLRSNDIRKYIGLMLNAPVSLQKHGIRLAFATYNTHEKIEMVSKLWETTKNSTIRTILFTSTFDLLCEENEDVVIQSVRLVLSSFIDDLSEEENKIIYKTLGKFHDVPLTVVGDFYEKTYLFLKSKNIYERDIDTYQVLEGMISRAGELIEHFSLEFVEKSLLGSISDIFSKEDSRICCNQTYLGILAAYLLCSKDKNIQRQKYKNLMQPMFDVCIPKWVNGESHLLEGIRSLLYYICVGVRYYVFEKKMTLPVKILSDIRDAILKNPFCVKEHYVLIRRGQLIVQYVEILDEMKKSDDTLSYELIRTASIPYMTHICYDLFVKDECEFFPSIYLLFIEVLKIVFNDFAMKDLDLLKILYKMLTLTDCSSMYLLVLEMIPEGRGQEYICWKTKIKKKIYFHPSDEVTMHYFNKYSDKYHTEDNNQDQKSDDSDNISSTCSTHSQDSKKDQKVIQKEKPTLYNYKFPIRKFLFGYRCDIL